MLETERRLKMSIVENKYHSTIKVEFRNLVDNIVNGSRKSYHMYTIHRLLSLGLLIDYPFKYVNADYHNAKVTIELDLKEDGKALFVVDPDSDYGIVKDENSLENLQQFLQHFDTTCEVKTKKGFFKRS
jgi:hypothetical protein